MTTAIPATAATSVTHRTALSVNVNKVALVRNTRHLGIPSVTRAALTGAQWQALEQALGTGQSPQAYTATLRAAAPVALALKSQLRTLLQYHCGSPLLRTRQLMMDLQNL